MNINLYYKGQTLSIKTDRKFDLKRIFEFALPKFDQHYYQELLTIGSNLRLTSKRTISALNFNDIVGVTLQDNDTIIIEPRDNPAIISPNIHTPKRKEVPKLDTNISPVSVKPFDQAQMRNVIKSKTKDSPKYPYPVDNTHQDNGHRYQKSDQSHVVPKNSRSPFDRSDLRRSLGADVAPQYDIPDYSATRIDNSSTNYDSESSISDFSNLTKPATNKRPVQLRNLQSKSNGFEKHQSISKSAPASPTKPPPPPRSPHTHMSMLNAHNVRTIGNKICISITKKPNFGLGFTIVTRDNQVLYGSAADIANSVVILVNKILANGGAAEDNRLRPGDRLLEVNGVSVTSLKDATEKLRSTPENESVNLLISRVERYETPTKEFKSQNSTPTQQSKRQITFEIPLNRNQKEKPQLGLSIRCLEDHEHPVLGPGIYIHSILPKSLASQQGDLRVDDKLIGINGRSLTEFTVEETIDQLKRVMQKDSVLIITVCRAIVIEPIVTDMVKEQNKMSMDRKSRQSSESHNMVHSSLYSSSDSLSHQNSSNYTPDQGSAFVRESKGRRSMSDKRKAHEDASQYNFYQETRVGKSSISDDRLYSTLPTTSRLKNLSNNQSPHLTNKTQAPVKPSQIKQLNTPKSCHDQTIISKAPKIPNRSVSLRNSPTKVNQPNKEIIDPSPSPKRISQTPTQDLQPGFNRAMNNSFKRAVQKSHPSNGPSPSTEISHSIRKELTNIPKQNSLENPYPIYTPNQNIDKIPRCNSVKVPVDKKKSFNLKNFLTFTSNTSRTKTVATKEKSDTFPLNQQAQCHQSSTNKNTKKNPHHSSAELPREGHQSGDPIIIDSTKRVLEWQIKNEDVILKESKTKEQKVYQTISLQGTVTSKSKPDVNITARTPISGRNTFPKGASHPGHETDPYDSLDGTLLSPTGLLKQKSVQPVSARVNSHSTTVHISPKNGVNNSLAPRGTYQANNSIKTVPSNDIYATVNKSKKSKSTKSHQESSGGISQGHMNKYRF